MRTVRIHATRERFKRTGEHVPAAGTRILMNARSGGYRGGTRPARSAIGGRRARKKGAPRDRGHDRAALPGSPSFRYGSAGGSPPSPGLNQSRIRSTQQTLSPSPVPSPVPASRRLGFTSSTVASSDSMANRTRRLVLRNRLGFMIDRFPVLQARTNVGKRSRRLVWQPPCQRSGRCFGRRGRVRVGIREHYCPRALCAPAAAIPTRHDIAVVRGCEWSRRDQRDSIPSA